jgi:hypothetical protein
MKRTELITLIIGLIAIAGVFIRIAYGVSGHSA